MDAIEIDANKARCATPEYLAALNAIRKCTLCGTELGSLNGPDGELVLWKHYADKHPGQDRRTVLK